MTREQKIRRAQELRAEGWTYQRIGAELGVTHGCAYKWLHPEKARAWYTAENHSPGRQAQKNAWERDNYLSDCPDCGATISRKSGRCRGCDKARRARESYGPRLEELWAEGRTLPEIAAELGTTVKTLGVTMYRLRRQGGYDLPYRYAVSGGKRVAA